MSVPRVRRFPYRPIVSAVDPCDAAEMTLSFMAKAERFRLAQDALAAALHDVTLTWTASVAPLSRPLPISQGEHQ